ncbi:DNA polymerase III subunit chi [Candidatus Pantoea edessiphila]|uniref:DNA polymerase III subunit chi n=1 Tax=Candidatus Pantoea edessiphila TaxID=2044610 RepID=A0A2P5T054_9GAMM|nr:DNA polymerase III subunit chi [Candidatus Pantoea edessiphila]PPI87943.1 DNA polymerase III subunit chi [Candidatus Pantoea edessiphila]
MKKVTFYVISADICDNGLNNIEELLCYIVKKNWYRCKKVLICCENQQQATRIDEILWKKPLDSFLPHNFIGGGPVSGAPIEITWLENKTNLLSYDILINLLINVTESFTNFKEIIDFVPYEEYFKKLARIRYKEYSKLGFKLNTIIL